MTSVPSAPLTFPRNKRIKQGRDFLRAKSIGKRLSQGVLIMNWVTTSEQGTRRLGVITSRRVGKAHFRNRARRLLRESFRRHQHIIQESTDLILVARPSIIHKRLADVEKDFLVALRRAKLLKASS